uniref:Uncharacterized protein n=1 Tax=Solanum tuberosum TaxID=4113 RepID=M1E0C3_SOLTU
MIMVNKSEDIGLTKTATVHPSTTEQNELIVQLMQQISEMRVELQKKQDLPISTVTVNVLGDEWPTLYFPLFNSNTEHVLNSSSNHTKNHSTLELATSNLHHANTSYQAPPPLQNLNTNPQVFPPLQNQNANNSQIFPHFKA